MAKRIAEVDVVANLDTKKYHSELKALSASTIAELDAIGREKVKVNIEIEKNEIEREIVRVKKKLHELGKIDKGDAGYKQAAANTKQFESYLEDLKIQLLENGQALKEYRTALKTIGVSEKEQADQLKRLRALTDSHRTSVLSDAAAMRDRNEVIDENVTLMQRLKGAINDDNDAIRKFNAVWRVFTNSQNPLETFRKTLREPVKIGPFTATVRGLLTFSSALGPVLMSLGGAVVSLAGVIGSALVGSLQLGAAALGGFGQAFLGLKFALGPVAEEMKIAKQATDAYQKAVLKYGEGSKQAKKAQEQMNNVLKNVSPLARQASTSLSEAQASFMRLTNPTRESASRVLADVGRTARQMSGQFAVNTNRTALGMQQGMSGFLSQVRQSQSERGGGPFNQMFSAAAGASRPLTAALGNITMYLARIGASASRHIGPLVTSFSNWSQSLLGGASNVGALNSTVDRMVGSLKSVGRLALAATRWLGALAGVSNEAGRSLVDGLTNKFEQWTRALSSEGGRKKWTDWFNEAISLTKSLGNALIPIVKTIGQWSAALTPFMAGIASATAGLSSFLGQLLRLPLVSEAVRMLGAALTSLYIGTKIVAIATAFNGMVRAILGARLAVPIISALATRIPLLGVALAGLSANPFVALMAGLGALATYFAITKGKSDSLANSIKKIDDQAKELMGTMASSSSQLAMNELQIASNNQQLKGLNPNSIEARSLIEQNRQLARDVSTLQNEINNSLRAINQGSKSRVDETEKEIKKVSKEFEILKNVAGNALSDEEVADYVNKLKDLNVELEKRRNLEAGQAIANKRALSGEQGGLGRLTSQALQASIGSAIRAGGERYALDIALNPRLNDGQMAQQLNAVTQALQAGVSQKDIEASLKLDPSQALRKLREFINIRIPTKNSLINVSSNASSVVNGVIAQFNRLSSIVGVSVRVPQYTGGVVSAAGGYSIDSAIGRAENRPTRNVGQGAIIREPTLALGEENRREYVIATNPAYRSQNVRYLKMAANELGLSVVESAAGGMSWRQRKVRLNAIFNPSLDDKKRKVFSRDVRNSAAGIKGLEDESSALSKMMDNAEKLNRPNSWKRYRRARERILRQLLGIYRSAYPAAGRNNRRSLRNMIAGVEGDIIDLRADTFDNASVRARQDLQQAEIDRRDRENSVLRANLAASQAFNVVSGGMLAESFGPLRSGGPRMSSKAGGGTTIIVNTLHPGDPNTLVAIGEAATAGQSFQGAVVAPRVAMAV